MQTRWLGWPQLSPERFEEGVCVWNAAAPEWHPVGPFPCSRSEPKWALPPTFLPTCVTTSAATIGQLDVGIKTVARGKMAQCSSWWYPTRSFASIINVSEISAQKLCWTYRGRTPFHRFSPPHGLVYVARNPVNLLDSDYATPLLKPILPR
jgi:hypothetical protein